MCMKMPLECFSRSKRYIPQACQGVEKDKECYWARAKCKEKAHQYGYCNIFDIMRYKRTSYFITGLKGKTLKTKLSTTLTALF